MKLILILLVSQGIMSLATAQSVTVDPTFGGSGTGYIKLLNQLTVTFSNIKVMDDSKLLLTGVSYVEVAYLSVGRLHPTGQPDSTFSGDGFITFNNLKFTEILFKQTIVVLPGNIIQIGAYAIDTTGANALYFLVRLKPDGSLDSTFAADGIKLFHFTGNNYGIFSYTTDASGNTFLIGTEADHQVIWKLQPDGEEDFSFGNGGSITFPLYQDTTWVERGDEIALLPGGGFMTTAAALVDGNGVGYVITRLLPNGIPDPSFGEGGSFYFPSVDYGQLSSLHVLPDGSSVMENYYTYDPIIVFKLDASGQLVQSFGNNGIGIIDNVDGPLTQHALLINPDGSMLLSFRDYINGEWHNYIQCFNADFTIDTVFGDSSIFEIPAELDALFIFSMYFHEDKVLLSISSDYMDYTSYPTLLRLNVEKTVAVGSNVAFENNITIFPNPVGDMLTISTTDNHQVNAIRIVNSMGRVLYETDQCQRENMQLSLQDFSPGIYTVIMQFDEGIVSRQFIHQ